MIVWVKYPNHTPVVGNPNGIEDRGVETLWLIRFPATCREDSTTRFIVGYDRSPELSIS
jgi:hypothetical protein